MRKLLGTASLAVLLAAAPALAATGDNTAATGAGATQAAGAQTLSPQDQDFVRQAALSGRLEMETSRLAQQHAQDGAVRMFARWMIADHGMADTMLRQLANAAGAQMPPDALDPQHQQMVQKLQGLNGDRFDQEYVTGQVQAHEIAVQLFQKEAQSGQNGQLRAFAQMMTPSLQAHLDAAKDLQGRATAMGGTGTGMSGQGMGQGTGQGAGMAAAPLGNQDTTTGTHGGGSVSQSR